MTPYELKEAERKFREQFTNIANRNGPATTMLGVIFNCQSVILSHLADVEAEATSRRRHEGRDD
ncbi:MAG: hypothetical protein JWP25_3586 [Bradyrhizobium sp.]|nr:hypothetical protein [Bradyrhizobium sp.]